MAIQKRRQKERGTDEMQSVKRQTKSTIQGAENETKDKIL